MRFLTISLLLLPLLPLPARAQDRFRRAVEIGTVDSVWSATLKEYRPYLVYTPPSYGDTTLLSARCPVLYLLDGDVLLKGAREYFSTARLPGKALYVAQANTVQPDDSLPNPHFSAIARFDAVLNAYNRSGIRYGFRYFHDDDHGSVPLIAEYNALRFIFDGYKVPLARVMADPALLTEHFRQVSERLGGTSQPTEGMVRLLAAVSLTQDTTKAITFGEMRVGMHPENHRGYVFLGDIWAGKGDVERARHYYQEALARSPGNTALMEEIGKLGR